MSPKGTLSTRKRLRRVLSTPDLFSFFLFVAATVALQFWGGAFRADFGGNSDEGGHYVTGLMMHDYIANLRPTSPIHFAENYYVYYPKVAIGHWPPVFYMVQSAWTLLFTPSRVSILLLMAVITALLATTVFQVVRAEFGTAAGVLAGFFIASLPIIQLYTAMVMSESLVALLVFWAVIYFGRYLDNGKWQDAAMFGVIASIAILTKGNALSLALIPPVAVILLRRPGLFLRLSFWYPALIVALLCGPWYYKTRQMAENGWMNEWGSQYTFQALRFFPWELVKVVGIGLSLIAIVGWIVRISKSQRKLEGQGRWVSAGALLIAVLLFQFAVPAALDHRYIIPAIPAVVLFIAAGASWLTNNLPLKALSLQVKALIVVCVMAGVFGAEVFAIPKKADHGFTQVAKDLLSQPRFEKSVFLISSDSNGEGAFISEVARLEHRPGHILVRAFKVLSKNRWADRDNNVVYQTPTEVMNYLDSIPIGIIVMDTTPDAMHIKHHQQLMQMVKDFPDRWELLGTYPGKTELSGHESKVLVYRLVGHESRPVNKVRIDMQYMLNRSIEGDRKGFP